MKEQLPSLWITSLLQENVLHVKSNIKGLNDTVISALVYLQWAVNRIAKKQSVIILSCVLLQGL